MKRALGFMNKSQVVTYNTYIGGVSGTISTVSLLATKLGISVGAISNFTVVGSDIKCRITGSYAIPNDAFLSNSSITYYNDNDGLVSSLGSGVFYLSSLSGDVSFINATSVGGSCFRTTKSRKYILTNTTSIGVDCFRDCAYSEKIYIPNCTTLGVTVGYDSVFFQMRTGTIIYCHPSLATNNGGAPDGDIASAISAGMIIRYVTNFTAPNPITDLTIGTVYGTALQVNFTPPIGSTNAIEFYDCYANGIYKNTITASGQYIVGLTASTSYTIEVKPRDILYNESSSNSVTQSTNTTSAVPTGGLVSNYKLDETTGAVANDSYGTQHLTNSGVSINQSGKIGTAYKATVAGNVLSTITATPITGNFTINIWAYRTANGTSSYNLLCAYGRYADNAGFSLITSSTGGIGWIVNQTISSFGEVIPTNKWSMVTLVYNSTSVKVYLNSLLVMTIAHTTNPNSSTKVSMFTRTDYGGTFIGHLDECLIYNTTKTQNEIDILYNLGTGITL